MNIEVGEGLAFLTAKINIHFLAFSLLVVASTSKNRRQVIGI